MLVQVYSSTHVFQTRYPPRSSAPFGEDVQHIPVRLAQGQTDDIYWTLHRSASTEKFARIVRNFELKNILIDKDSHLSGGTQSSTNLSS